MKTLIAIWIVLFGAFCIPFILHFTPLKQSLSQKTQSIINAISFAIFGLAGFLAVTSYRYGAYGNALPLLMYLPAVLNIVLTLFFTLIKKSRLFFYAGVGITILMFPDLSEFFAIRYISFFMGLCGAAALFPIIGYFTRMNQKLSEKTSQTLNACALDVFMLSSIFVLLGFDNNYTTMFLDGHIQYFHNSPIWISFAPILLSLGLTLFYRLIARSRQMFSRAFYITFFMVLYHIMPLIKNSQEFFDITNNNKVLIAHDLCIMLTLFVVARWIHKKFVKSLEN